MNVTCRKRNLLQVIIRKVNKEKPENPSLVFSCFVVSCLFQYLSAQNRSIIIQRHITRARDELLEIQKDQPEVRAAADIALKSANLRQRLKIIKTNGAKFKARRPPRGRVEYKAQISDGELLSIMQILLYKLPVE